MTHDHPSGPSSDQDFIDICTNLLVTFQCPPSIPERSIGVVKCFFLLSGTLVHPITSDVTSIIWSWQTYSEVNRGKDWEGGGEAVGDVEV